MDMSRAASSSNPTPTKRCLIVDVDVDVDELPSPTPSPVHLAIQQPQPMEMEAPTAALSSKSKPMVIDLEELPSPTTSPAHLPAQQPFPMDIDMETPTAAVSSKPKAIMDLEELPSPTRPAANPPSWPMETSFAAASSSKPKFTKPLTMEAIFEDFSSRRDALIRALTTDQEEFFGLCDPGKKALLLYGHADGNWEVTRPEEMLPPDLPEPALGLNFVRDDMTRFDWLSLVAVHADSWLAGLPHYFGLNLNASQRMRLFDMMIDLPTVYETFAQFYEHDSVWLPTNMPPSPDFMHNVYKQNNSSRAPAEENVPLSSDLVQNVSNPNKDSSTPAEDNVPLSPGLMQNVSNPNNDSRTHDEDIDEELEVSDQTFCAACGARYHANGFWICCDICDRWFHGKCVKITASEAEHIYQYKCPDCKREEIGE